MEAYTREQKITIKAPVIVLKMTKDEAQYLARAINPNVNDTAWAAVGILTNELENPSFVKNTGEYD
jgi:hypothetical protein